MAKKKAKKKQKETQVEFTPMFYTILGEEISPVVAYKQAARLLDMASVYVVECNDIEGITTMARAWAEIAVLMQGTKPEGEEQITRSDIGFKSLSSREVLDGTSKG